MSRLLWNVRNESALTLERVGRYDEAIAELTALATTDRADVTACELANAAHNVGFGILLRNRARRSPCAGDSPAADPAPWLQKSIAFGERGCPDAYRVAMSHVFLGEAALDAGRSEDATRELELARLGEAGNELRSRSLDLEGRVALARNDDSTALATFERLLAFARANGRLDDERRALEGKGEALERLGRWRDALDAFQSAEELLVSASVLVPLGEGPFFQGARDRASRARVEILLARGRVDDALEVARRARARLLAAASAVDRISELDAASRERWSLAIARFREERKKLESEGEHDWELATRELVRVREARSESLGRLRSAFDEALAGLRAPEVTFAPFGSADETVLFATTLRDGVAAFVATGEGVRAAHVEGKASSDVATLTAEIALAARAELERARNVRIVTSADLSCLDFHTVPVGVGEPLGLRANVSYGLDLGDAVGASEARTPLALVVSDTRDDLPLARDEGALATAKLGNLSHGTVRYLSGATAQGPAVRDALALATLFHYAGHAEELDGELVLPLAAGGRLTPADVLALPQGPLRVVLSACEAGRVDPRGLALGIGLVSAFLERGASEVIAPSRRVRDDLARDLAEALTTWDSGDFDRSLRELARTRPDADWGAYRVWRR
ncbi:MAG TPA: CHAT domain-containing protein [Labilithrix sp.]|nr:CHAT domain-containing protein [Labilithrix sp.]